jgi:hypothetical protein
MRKDQVELLQQFQVPIFSETSLRQKLSGEKPVQVQTTIISRLSAIG